MKKISIPVFFATSCMLATMALAATTNGVVKSVDTKGDSITLVDGSVYILTEGFEAETFKPGQKVAVTFATKNGKLMASSIKITK